MVTFTIRRLLASIPVLLGILLATFALGRLIPGDPCHVILGERAREDVCQDFMERRGYNRPIPLQFAIYIGDVLRGDFGDSISENRPVMDILIERLPVTIELSVAAFALAVLVGVPLGIFSAV